MPTTSLAGTGLLPAAVPGWAGHGAFSDVFGRDTEARGSSGRSGTEVIDIGLGARNDALAEGANRGDVVPDSSPTRSGPLAALGADACAAVPDAPARCGWRLAAADRTVNFALLLDVLCIFLRSVAVQDPEQPPAMGNLVEYPGKVTN